MIGIDAFVSKDDGIPKLLETFDAFCPQRGASS
jgi:hypothetical protein